MSLNSLAAGRVARDMATIVPMREFSVASEDTLGLKEQDVQNALSALVEYVPAETITLYLALLSALPALVSVIPGLSAAAIYWLFGGLTPLLFSAIYAGKRRAAGQPRSPGFKRWPWWSMIAATIAFLAWGLAVPGGPYLASESGRVLSGLVAIVVSTLLGVGGRFFATQPE